MHAHIWCVGIHARALAGCVAETIAYRILDAECRKIKTLERAFDGGDVDADCAFNTEPLRPAQRQSSAIDVIFVAVARGGDLPQDATGDAAFKIDAINQRPWSREC